MEEELHAIQKNDTWKLMILQGDWCYVSMQDQAHDRWRSCSVQGEACR